MAEGTGRESLIYTRRHRPAENAARQAAWRALCRDFLQRYVDPAGSVVDVGAGDGLFLAHIRAARRVAVDLSPHVGEFAAPGVEVVTAPATRFAEALGTPVDVIFMSNFLEHLPEKRLVMEVFDECRRALKPGGRLLILQPDIRHVGAAYWDFIDHHIALTAESLTEALDISGFTVEECIPRFLPYTAKSRLSRFSFLVGLYLKIPFLWQIFGQQAWIAARPRPA